MADYHMLSDRDRRDIQGLVLYGTTCPLLRYHFVRVDDAVGGRRLVGALTEPGPLRVATAGLRDKDARSESLVYVGITWSGLQALRVSAVALGAFPEEFRAGAKARAANVGDDGPSAPDRWLFDPDTVHIAVMIYARTAERLDELSRELQDTARVHGCTLVTTLNGEALPEHDHPSGQRIARPVHFGFTDGISQPQIAPAANRRAGSPPAVPPGMFVLGHHDSPQDGESFAVANEPLPQPGVLTRNGTFGAFRMLEQDCDAFESFLDQNAQDADARELLAARICGRWRNGVPLSLSPGTPHPEPAIDPSAYNSFDYRPTRALPDAKDDRSGAICPVGSHIRRANPRSSEVLGGMGNRLRLIRRGMPYGPPHVRGDGQSRGMLGLFLCVSLKHQFEFIMRHWVNDGLFARGLPPGDKDPMTGSLNPGDTFSYRAGDDTVTVGLSRFVTTRAAAYLFFPSITGLRYISQLADRRPTDNEHAAIDEAIEFVVASMIRGLGDGTTRDAHPKHHGVVRATVDISKDIPPNLRHGLFRAPCSFRAYVRFSNGRPTVMLPPDAAPDVRGMAIKLLGIDGPKETPDEQRTHDFILASHPVFFVPDVFTVPRLPDVADARREAARVPGAGTIVQVVREPADDALFQPDALRPGPAGREVRHAADRAGRAASADADAGADGRAQPALPPRGNGSASLAGPGDAGALRPGGAGCVRRVRGRRDPRVGRPAPPGRHDHHSEAGVPLAGAGRLRGDDLLQPLALPAGPPAARHRQHGAAARVPRGIAAPPREPGGTGQGTRRRPRLLEERGCWAGPQHYGRVHVESAICTTFARD